MKKKTGLFICFCLAVLFACIGISLLYKGFAFGGLNISISTLQSAALVILSVILGIVICVRLVIPLFEKRDTSEVSDAAQSSVLYRCTDFGAWLFLGLALASLVASPLASTADYIGYAALFGVVFAALALFPVISKAEKLAEAVTNEKVTFCTAIAALPLSVIPAVGAYAAIGSLILSVTAMREEIIAKNKGIVALSLNIFSLLLSAILSLLFIMNLL